MSTVKKGECLTCEYCRTEDDGYERQLRCTYTKRGRKITWYMHTGSVSGGWHMPDGYIIGGKFIPDSISQIDKRLRDSMKNCIPPTWCHKRQ